MKQRHLSIAVLVGAALLALPMTGGAQILVSGNDEKVLWDDAGKTVYLPPGKDTISFIDIGDRENPKILTRSRTASLGRLQILPCIQAVRLRWSLTQ